MLPKLKRKKRSNIFLPSMGNTHLTTRGYFIFKEKALRLFSAAGLFVLIFIIWSSSAAIVSAQSDEEIKNNLRAQLQDVQQKIAEYQDNINEIKKNQKTLEREVSILDKQTEEAKNCRFRKLILACGKWKAR